MGSYRIEDADARTLDAWDDLVASSENGTIFHRRRFLSYHGDRFAGEERFLQVVKGETPIALLSLAVSEQADGTLLGRSPYGASYGGFVWDRYPTYAESRHVASAFVDMLGAIGIGQVDLTMPPDFCSRHPLHTFVSALMELGFRSANREISSVVPLRAGSIDEAVSGRARRTQRRAEHAEIRLQHRAERDDFWSVLSSTFAKHGERPTHTRDEWERLCQLFPRDVYVDVAYEGDRPVAGIGHVVANSRVSASFYLCQDPARQGTGALTALVLEALRRSQEAGFAFFDLGTSSVGGVARPNIFEFKEQFASVGFFRETLRWLPTR